MENVLSRLVEFLTIYGIKVVGAIIILIIGRIVAGFARKVIRRVLRRSNVDESIVGRYYLLRSLL